MANQIQRYLHLAVFIFSCLGSRLEDETNSCKVSPFLDKRSHASFLGNTKHIVNGLCVEEDDTDLNSKPPCVSYAPDTATPPVGDNIIMTSQKPSSAAKGENKSKVADVNGRKGHVKKQLGATKKLKGSKRQRKKNKKKKMGKKKKKS
ncbi:uncharacterized protein LOC131940703 isoform X2 [Physella acuta]|uniref:uncharacterized protein LOC131940703 isoform X2 n=1 Tax=Physella acuta TaxID=109671 RepID=UPI0027DD221F|nr:uncharacterized protein LOC131940703 isoform X2 [Physella acuta]